MKTFYLFLLVLTVPTVSAGWGATIEGGAETYNIAAASLQTATPTTTLVNQQITLANRLGYALVDSEIVFEFSYTAHMVPGTAGDWRYRAFWDGQYTGCEWGVRTVSSLPGVNAYEIHAYSVACRLNGAAISNGPHTLTVTRSVLSGTPQPPSRDTISYRIDKTDILEQNMTNDLLEAAAVLGGILLALTFTILATRDDYGVTALLLHLGAVLIAAAYVINPGAGFEYLRMPTAILALYNVARITLLSIEARNEAQSEN